MNSLYFYGLLDFFPRKEEIKNKYQGLSKEEQRIFKMYVYSLPFEEDRTKDLIWEYLNEWDEALFDLSMHYRKRKNLNDKRQQRYKNEVNNEI